MRAGLSYHEALSIARTNAPRLGDETVSLACALGRVAAMDIDAPFSLPGFVNSAMDGFAIRGEDLPIEGERQFRIVARIFAGDTAPYELGPGDAAAIMTGALMPVYGDTVVVRENARIEGDDVWLPADAPRGGNVRPVDDDCTKGDRVLSHGNVLTAAKLAVLASFGISHANVSRQPRVAIVTTGDELLASDEPIVPGRRYDSNGTLLAAAAAAAGAQIVAHERCGDNPKQLAQTLRRLSARADLLLTSGGVSAGEADHLPAVIGRFGEILFWKVRMKPGMPVLCARAGDCLIIALPGNPVSAGVVFQALARPALDAMQGRQTPHGVIAQARLTSTWRKRHSRLEFLRVRLGWNERGELLAMPFDHQGSGALSILADADALALLPEGEHDYRAGDLVEVRGCAPPWSS